jgi:hypothetical protein
LLACKLCDEQGELCRSHIIPEFLYRPLYNHKHRCTGIVESGNKVKDVIQKGIRERMLCKQCEGRFSELERYAATVIRNLPSMTSLQPGAICNIVVDYKKFKLFQLSLIWRCGVAKHQTYSSVSLGEKHESKIRNMLLNGHPGSALDYPVLYIRPRGRGSFEQYMLPPSRERKLNHVAYNFFMAGMYWIFFISSHTDQIKQYGSFLSEGGTLPID